MTARGSFVSPRMGEFSKRKVPDALRADVETLWSYHRVDDPLRPVDVAIGLGSHDPSVATYTAELYHAGLFRLIVFTGANAPTTVERFPRGEAVHYREIALSADVPDNAIIIEPDATNTCENFEFSRDALARRDVQVRTALIVCRPYQQRRAHATAGKVWPGVQFSCSAVQQSLTDYVASIGDPERVINMLVGDTQRLTVYADAGYAAPVTVPENVHAAYQRLVDAGYTSRLVRAS